MKAALAFLLGSAQKAGACAVCFGAADGTSGLSRAIFWAIILLLTVTMGIVAAIAYGFVVVERGRAARP